MQRLHDLLRSSISSLSLLAMSRFISWETQVISIQNFLGRERQGSERLDEHGPIKGSGAVDNSWGLGGRRPLL